MYYCSLLGPVTSHEKYPTLHWLGGVEGHLRLIDQTRLPAEFVEIDCRNAEAGMDGH